jgi:hypothetical protein
MTDTRDAIDGRGQAAAAPDPPEPRRVGGYPGIAMTDDTIAAESEAAPDLNPVLDFRELPVEIAHARGAADALYAQLEPVVVPRIEAHMEVCDDAHKELSTYHAGVADRLDFDVRGYTRPAALWAVSGRCLGLLRAVLVQVGAGVCSEAFVTGRGLHEAIGLLLAVGLPDEDALLRKWLDDDGKYNYVKAAQSHAASGRLAEKLNQLIAESGADDVAPDMSGPSAQQYDLLSRAGHNRRQAVLDAVSVPLRRMVVGYDPDPLARARQMSWANTATGNTVMFVGDALGLFIQSTFRADVLEPLNERLAEVRRTHPLDRDAILRDAGLT